MGRASEAKGRSEAEPATGVLARPMLVRLVDEAGEETLLAIDPAAFESPEGATPLDGLAALIADALFHADAIQSPSPLAAIKGFLHLRSARREPGVAATVSRGFVTVLSKDAVAPGAAIAHTIRLYDWINGFGIDDRDLDVETYYFFAPSLLRRPDDAEQAIDSARTFVGGGHPITAVACLTVLMLDLGILRRSEDLLFGGLLASAVWATPGMRNSESTDTFVGAFLANAGLARVECATGRMILRPRGALFLRMLKDGLGPETVGRATGLLRELAEALPEGQAGIEALRLVLWPDRPPMGLSGHDMLVVRDAAAEIGRIAATLRGCLDALEGDGAQAMLSAFDAACSAAAASPAPDAKAAA